MTPMFVRNVGWWEAAAILCVSAVPVCAWLVQAGGPARFRLQRELEVAILDPDGTPSTMVGELVLASNSVFVALPAVPAIVVLDSSGRSLGAMGRKGAGPGEFTRLHAMYRLADSLVVVDPSLNRFTLFTVGRPGKVIRTVTMGRALTALLQRGAALGAKAPARDSTSKWPLYLSSWDGTIRDTIMQRPYPRGATVRIPGPGRSISFLRTDALQAFDDGPLLRVAPGAAAFLLVDWPVSSSGSGGEYRIALIEPDLDTTLFLRRKYDPKPVSAQHLNAVIDELAQRASRVFGSVEAVRPLVRDAFRPKFYSPVSDAFVGDDASIWIAGPGGSPTVEWRIIDRGGKELGSLSVPTVVRLKAGSLTGVWGVRESEAGEWTLVRFRVLK